MGASGPKQRRVEIVVSGEAKEKVYGGVVPALEAEIAGLRADLDFERGYTESARADVNALRCRNREAAGRIDRLEAEVSRLRSVEAALASERARISHLSGLLSMQEKELERERARTEEWRSLYRETGARLTGLSELHMSALRGETPERVRRIAFLEAEIARLESAREASDSGYAGAIRILAARYDYLRRELVKYVAAERGIAAGTREFRLLRAEIIHDANLAAEGETEAERDARHLADRAREHEAQEAAEREHEAMEADYQRSLRDATQPDAPRG